jgi:hypothetical protein
MSMPDSVKIQLVKLPPEAQVYAEADYRYKKKVLFWAYFWCLTIGAHYFYLKRPKIQMLFYVTCGGVFVWWAIDALLLLVYVDRCNEQIARDIITQYRVLYADTHTKKAE